MFDDAARMLVISWVLFEDVSTLEAARRLMCDRNTAAAWVKAYKDTGEWWPDPAIRNRHADNVQFDEHFVRAVSAFILSDPEQLFGEMTDVFIFYRLCQVIATPTSAQLPPSTACCGLRATYTSSSTACVGNVIKRGGRLSPGYFCQSFFGASCRPTRPTRTAGTYGDDAVGGCVVRVTSASRVTAGRC